MRQGLRVAIVSGALALDRVGEEAQQSQSAADDLAVETAMEERGGDAGAGDADDDVLPAKLLNNAAALHLQGGEKEAALELMYEAVEVDSSASGRIFTRRPTASEIPVSRRQQSSQTLGGWLPATS